MAQKPCDRHGTPRPGRLCGAYPALVVDGVRKAKYVRLCTDCTRDLLTAHAGDWLDAAVGDPLAENTACTGCGSVQPTNADLNRFYCTVYLDGKQRRDYSAVYCTDCTKERVKEFSFDG